MAALAQIAPSARQPFGVLDGTKIRNLQSIKNRQNAIHSSPAVHTATKRRHASPDNVSDSENVDPNIINSMSKRKRIEADEGVSKSPLYNLMTVPSATARVSALSTLTTHHDSQTAKSSIISSNQTSVLAAAGRSPTKLRREGILSRRRISSNAPFRRAEPPTFGSKHRTLSIAAALQGTLAHKKAKHAPTVQEYKPKGWFFDIYEESEAQQDYTVNEWSMTQSACILDISDDEKKAKLADDRGKENIPPFEIPITSAPSVQTSSSTMVMASRKDMMIDEARVPLGDLNPSDYYAEGCDATSVVLVPDDTEAEMVKGSSFNSIDVSETTMAPPLEAPSMSESDEDPNQASLAALLASSAPPGTDEIQVSRDENNDEAKTEAGNIEIWESESAKGEEDEENQENSIFAV